MKKYTYYFADGTKSTIEVEDKWYDILKEMDEAERKSKYNYDRHNKSASLFDYEGDAFIDDKADPFENLMREKQREQLDAAIASLHSKSVSRLLRTDCAVSRKNCKNFWLTPLYNAIFEPK